MTELKDTSTKIQIVAFSTNDETNSPNEIINMFLENKTHNIIKKTKHSMAFSMVLQGEAEKSKIMICSVINLTREYAGIDEVNCYLIFIDLNNEEAENRIQSIMTYVDANCDKSRKFFIIPMITDSSAEVKLNQEKIKGYLKKNGKINFDIKNLNLVEKPEEVPQVIENILLYSKKHPIVNKSDGGEGEEEDEGGIRNDNNAGSCTIW